MDSTIDMETGFVKRLLKHKGYGFITRSEKEDIYFDRRVVCSGSFDALSEGEPVMFKAPQQSGPVPGKSPRATYVKSMRLLGR